MMSTPFKIRLGGYGPPTTCFSRALKFIGDRLTAEFGNDVDVKYVWNVMDFGYRAEDILWLVESGVLTLGYQSSSYLTDRIPELSVVDLPFLFADNASARAAIDGELGQFSRRRSRQDQLPRARLFRERLPPHLQPPARAACAGGSRRHAYPRAAQQGAGSGPSSSSARCRCGSTSPRRSAITAGTVDAQENPLANTVTYGVHKVHPFHTLTNHFYISRPIFLHRPPFDAWPPALKDAMREAVKDAVAWQRDLAVEEDRDARTAIEAAGGTITRLTLGSMPPSRPP